MTTSVFDLPKQTVTVRYDRCRWDLLLHLAMPKATKDTVTKFFALLRKNYYYCPENRQTVEIIRDWFYVATDRSLQAWKQASKAYVDGYRDTTGKPQKERSRIMHRNNELKKDVATAKRVNERLEDRLQLFETMFKGMLE